jgi:hypothetical protein
MKDYVFTVRFDRRLVTGLKRQAAYRGEVVAVILRQYVRDGLERDGFQVYRRGRDVDARRELHAA